MKKIIISSFMTVCACVLAFSQFSLPELKYDYDALEPYIDTQTMDIHYNTHHRAYVDNLNKAIAKHPELRSYSIEDLMTGLYNVPEDIRKDVRNNGGGHYNHTLFWSVLTPAGSINNKMSNNLKNRIERDFGSIDNFKSQFEKAATGRFGSGWVWLIKDNTGKLSIISTPNQDNPLMPDAEKAGVPLLGLDVWEHAYYLKYQSKRADYAKNFWNVVNWHEVERRLNDL